VKPKVPWWRWAQWWVIMAPALVVFYAVLSILFFSIAVHCVRHRYLFLEMTNLRELLDAPARRTIGGVAFDS